jgi:hypothetical protein
MIRRLTAWADTVAALLLIGIKPYRVSYVWGDGNDVVLCTGSDGTMFMFG